MVHGSGPLVASPQELCAYAAAPWRRAHPGNTLASIIPKQPLSQTTSLDRSIGTKIDLRLSAEACPAGQHHGNSVGTTGNIIGEQ